MGIELSGMLPRMLDRRKKRNRNRRRDFDRLVVIEEERVEIRVDLDALIRVGDRKNEEKRIEKRTVIDRKV